MSERKPLVARRTDIRPSRVSDAERLAELCAQLDYPSTTDEVRKRLDRIAGDEENAVFVAQARDGRAIGWIQIRVNPPYLVNNGLEAEILGLIVDENRRGQGVGKLLMKHAQDWARKQNCRFVRLRTNVVRDEAHLFYENLGYSKLKTQHVYKFELASPAPDRNTDREVGAAPFRTGVSRPTPPGRRGSAPADRLRRPAHA